MPYKRDKNGDMYYAVDDPNEADGDWIRAARLKAEGSKESLAKLKKMEENLLVIDD